MLIQEHALQTKPSFQLSQQQTLIFGFVLILIFRFLKKRNNRYIPFKNKNKKQIGYSLNNIPDSRSP